MRVTLSVLRALAEALLPKIEKRTLDAVSNIFGWLHPRPWAVFETPDGVHVIPIRDHLVHEHSGLDCVCGPDIAWADPETGDAYPLGPMVTHHSLDGREAAEQTG